MIDPGSQPSTERRWAAIWLRAEPELERIRRAELRALNAGPYFELIESVLHLGSLRLALRTGSGLVEQQRLFRKVRS